MEILRWASVVCSFGAVSLMIIWAFKSTEDAYRRGYAVLRRLEINPFFELNHTTWFAQAGRAGLIFVPAIRRMMIADRFGVNSLLERWQKLLIRAGMGNLLNPLQILSASLACSIAASSALILFLKLWGAGSLSAMIYGIAVGIPLGFFIPPIIIHQLSETRISLIEKRLPFAIEFMLIAMEASSSFPMAMSVYCERMKDDPLADELKTTLGEIDTGLGIHRGLARISDRLGSEPVSSFVLAINTGVETGQPIKEVLKIQADVSRQRRYKAAEEIAKKAGTQALFPLLLTMISVILLILGPLALKIVNQGLF